MKYILMTRDTEWEEGRREGGTGTLLLHLIFYLPKLLGIFVSMIISTRDPQNNKAQRDCIFFIFTSKSCQKLEQNGDVVT